MSALTGSNESLNDWMIEIEVDSSDGVVADTVMCINGQEEAEEDNKTRGDISNRSALEFS